MTEHDYLKALKLIATVERDLRRYLKNPARVELVEDCHAAITETCRLLEIEPEQKHED